MACLQRGKIRKEKKKSEKLVPNKYLQDGLWLNLTVNVNMAVIMGFPKTLLTHHTRAIIFKVIDVPSTKSSYEKC